MDIMLAGEDQSLADQPNSLAKAMFVPCVKLKKPTLLLLAQCMLTTGRERGDGWCRARSLERALA
eukprot:231259-Pelagomonas_calceolata.AAC.1